MPLAHVAGVPIEETLLMAGPAILLLAGGVARMLPDVVRRRVAARRGRGGASPRP